MTTQDNQHHTFVSHLPPLEFKVRHMPIKRTFDIVFSIFAIIFTLPICFFVALAVKFSSKGPIFYSHLRVGRAGKKFHCYKFRTMYSDADKRLKEILAQDPILREEWESQHKLKNDPRVTPLGKFLRKTSLDELPQFWNVLKGDLSVVGPRPVVELEIVKFLGPKAAKILSIRPGLTCFWQVSGRTDTSYDKRIALDEKYVDNRSLRLDLKLIAKTIPAMFNSRGAY